MFLLIIPHDLFLLQQQHVTDVQPGRILNEFLRQLGIYRFLRQFMVLWIFRGEGTNLKVESLFLIQREITC